MGFGSGVLGWTMTLEDRVTANAKQIGSQLDTLRTKGMYASQGLTMAGKAMTGVGIGLSAVLGVGIKDAVSYEGQLMTLGAVANLTAQEQAELGKQIDVMTAELPLSSKELATMAITASKLGLASKTGKEGLLAISKEASLLAKTLGFTEEETVGFIGKVGAVFDLYNQNRYTAEQMIQNTKGVSAALTEVALSSARSADFLSDVAVRAGGGAKAMGLSAAQIIGLAGALGDSGMQAQAAGMNLGNLAKKMITNSDAFADFIKKMRGVEAANQWLNDLEHNSSEAFTTMLETMGELKASRPQDAVKWVKELTGGSSRMALVFESLASKGITYVGEEMSELRRMLMLSEETFKAGAATSEKYEKVSRGVGMQLSVLTGSIRNISKGLGNVFLPVIRDDIMPVLVSIAGALVKMDNEFYRTVAIVIGVAAGFSLLSGMVLLASGFVVMFGAAIWAALWPATLIVGALTLAVGGLYLALASTAKEGETAWDVLKRGANDAWGASSEFVKGFSAMWEAMGPELEETFTMLFDAINFMLINLGLVDHQIEGSGKNWREWGEIAAAVLGGIIQMFAYLFTGIALGIAGINQAWYYMGDVFQTVAISIQKGLIAILGTLSEIINTVEFLPGVKAMGWIADKAGIEGLDSRIAGLQDGLKIMEEMQSERREAYKIEPETEFFRLPDQTGQLATQGIKERAQTATTLTQRGELEAKSAELKQSLIPATNLKKDAAPQVNLNNNAQVDVTNNIKIGDQSIRDIVYDVVEQQSRFDVEGSAGGAPVKVGGTQ